MATLDIFNNDAFSMRSLTSAIQKAPYIPSLLGSMGLFTPKPITTRLVEVEEREGVLSLIQSSATGAPPDQRLTEKRKLRPLKTVRLAHGDTIKANEIAGIRAFGSESELMMIQDEVTRRLTGAGGIMGNFEATWEYHRLGAVQGVLLDADGSTIYDFFSEFDITQDTEIDFDLDNASPASGVVRKKCAQVVRQTIRGMKVAVSPAGLRIVGLCGDTFWDELIAHTEVRATYLNQQEARQLREASAFEQLDYGGITFVNYRSTDDGSTIAVGATKCKFFPAGAQGVFEVAFSPHEDDFSTVNSMGRPLYPYMLSDPTGRNAYKIIEAYSYPLFYCTRPQALQRAKNT